MTVLGIIRGRRDCAFATMCRLSLAAGLEPLAWREMSLAEWRRAVERRRGS